MTKKVSEKGFVVLIAVIVVSIVLSIGIGILNITLRELILATVSRESLRAFYAADAGVDCAFHYDVSAPLSPPPNGNFASPLFDILGIQPSVEVRCNNNCMFTGVFGGNSSCDSESWDTGSTGYRVLPSPRDGYETILGTTTLADGSCFEIRVTKENFSSATDCGGSISSCEKTSIFSKGFNTCDTSNRRVQRALLLEWVAPQ